MYLSCLDDLIVLTLLMQDGHLETIENLSDEMREDYLLSVKKAIGMSLCRFIP